MANCGICTGSIYELLHWFNLWAFLFNIILWGIWPPKFHRNQNFIQNLDSYERRGTKIWSKIWITMWVVLFLCSTVLNRRLLLVRLCKYWHLVNEICFIRFEKSYIFFEISLGVYRCNISLQTEYLGAYLQIIPRFSNDECCRFRRFHIFFVVVSESGSLFNSNDVNSIHNRITAIFLFTDLKLSTNYVVQITIATTLFV